MNCCGSFKDFELNQKIKRIFIYTYRPFKMSAIIIKADKESNKILAELARKLGGNVLSIDDEKFEDLALGSLMDKSKTDQTVSREEIMKKLDR